MRKGKWKGKGKRNRNRKITLLRPHASGPHARYHGRAHQSRAHPESVCRVPRDFRKAAWVFECSQFSRPSHGWLDRSHGYSVACLLCRVCWRPLLTASLPWCLPRPGLLLELRFDPRLHDPQPSGFPALRYWFSAMAVLSWVPVMRESARLFVQSACRPVSCARALASPGGPLFLAGSDGHGDRLIVCSDMGSHPLLAARLSTDRARFFAGAHPATSIGSIHSTTNWLSGSR